ncbi:MAG TPA: histone deacetylase [Dehalococcoidia bacterium]|nr:histone deacetylase [Dehalococcoidia bacterium]
MKVGLVYDPIYLKHDTGHHVENARRLEETVALLEKSGVKQQLIQVHPEPASVEDLSLVHSIEYISQVESAARAGGGWLDADTLMSPASYEVALYAAGGIIKATEAVMKGEVDSAFALVRPPGHHAIRGRAMGFCLFNNIVIATKRIMKDYQLERILIVDFDVHHGNGTQEAFYHDSEVLYFSTHQYPFYPGTGSIGEVGGGEGEGTTVNVPLPAWCGDEEYLQVFQQILVPIAHRFQPQLILVSAGYDPHWADQISLMQVSITGFAQMVSILKGLALELCQGRLVFTLEGGYNTSALAYSIKATLEVLLGKAEVDDPLGKPTYSRGTPEIKEIIQQVKRVHSLE